jgi:hypothetical protein
MSSILYGLKMKKVIIMSIFSVLFHMFGCSSVSEKTPASSSSDSVVQDMGEKPGNGTPENTVGDLTPSASLNVDLKGETAFHYLLSEKELESDYLKAAELVKQAAHVSGDVAETSFRFAGWFVIVLKNAVAVGEEVVLDAPTHEMSAYLVDLAHQKVISKGDFKAARALMDRILEVSESGLSERKYQRLVNHFCALSSTVAFGHDGYVEGDPTDDSHAPVLRKDEHGFILTYDIHVGGETSVEYQRMTLKISDDQITYQVDAI